RVVDVDRALRVAAAKRVRDDLHVSGEHDQVDPLPVEQLEDAIFLRALVLWRHGKTMKRDAICASNRLEVAVIAEDDGDFARQLAGALAQYEVVQAVVVFRDEDSDAFSM